MIAVKQNVFVKIAAEDERFIYVKNNPAYQSFLNGFFEYQEEVSTKAGRVKKSSNKAGSYRNFLIFNIKLLHNGNQMLNLVHHSEN